MPLKRRKEVNHERERRKPANPVDTRTNPGRTRRNPERTHRDWETLAARVGDGTLADPAEERMDDPGFRLWLHFARTPRTMNRTCGPTQGWVHDHENPCVLRADPQRAGN